jgi:hypothetical protein
VYFLKFAFVVDKLDSANEESALANEESALANEESALANEESATAASANRFYHNFYQLLDQSILRGTNDEVLEIVN